MGRTKLEFAGHDGSPLAALLEYPAHDATCYALLAHCFSCGKDVAAASRISRALVARGIAVLRFDFTGLGNSDGDFANTNFTSNVEDLIRAADFLRDDYRAPQLLLGHSLGGTAVLAAAASIPESSAIVTIGAPLAPAHVIGHFAEQRAEIEARGQAEVSLGGRPFLIRRQFIDDVSQARIDGDLAKLRKALLVMHAPWDAIVSIDEAERIYRRAKHPKSFVSLDSADHLLTDRRDAEYVAATVAAWSSRYLEMDAPETRAATGVGKGQVVVGEHNHQFARTVASDAHRWLADEPASAGGHELGPDPYEHLLAALGTCTSMTIRMYANHKQIDLRDVTVTLSHTRMHARDCEDCDATAAKLEVLSREITLEGNLSAAERTRLLEIADKCPVHRTLTGRLEIRTQDTSR